jgi:glycine dehydrogenase subunit 1
MRYLPLTPQERDEILKLCEVRSFEELTSAIPKNLRLAEKLKLPPAMTEMELQDHFQKLGRENQALGYTSHLGQGAYDHSWPTVIDALISRGEFLTAYTPYQPEISQGTLQGIFEFQSLMTELLGTEVCNASLYDGGTALAEAILMAARITKPANGGVVYVSEGIYPENLKILQSFLPDQNIEIRTWYSDPKTFLATADSLENSGNTNEKPVVAVVMQSPNKWGLVEDWAKLSQLATKLNCQSVGHVSHAWAPAVFQSPGHAGIDIVSGEAQAMGIPVGFGGPYLGYLACRKKDVRQLPGRLVGITEDNRGKRAYCVTLATREQHIRREKATSNICSNQGLMALRATIFMTLMGPQGLERLTGLIRSNSHYLREGLKQKFLAKKIPLSVLEGDILNEISIVREGPGEGPSSDWISALLKKAESQKIILGLSLSNPTKSTSKNSLNIAVTERHKKADLDRLIEVVGV